MLAFPLSAPVLRFAGLPGLRRRLTFLHGRLDPLVMTVFTPDGLAATLARVGAVLAGLRIA